MIGALQTTLENAVKKTKLDVDLSQIMSKDFNEIIDRRLWDETVSLQAEFNSGVQKDWKENPNVDFWMAILDETLEVLNSRSWKWWKNTANFGVVDKDNIIVELTDIFLFLLSQSLKENTSELLYVAIANAEMDKETIEVNIDQKFFEEFWEKFLMACVLKSTPMVIIHWVEFWYRAGGNINDLFKSFRVKAALNNIRQEFGYGSGKYIKDWVGEEDNVVAYRLAENIELTETLVDDLTSKLRKYYLEKVV